MPRVLLALALALALDARGALDPPSGERKADGNRRVALVIGNAKYALRPLANPENDARAIGKVLADLRFELVGAERGGPVLNAGREAMMRALDRFAAELGTAEVGLFYFAGHGVQIDGRNYLVPLGVRLDDERQIRFNAVSLDDVLARFPDGLRAKIVILDACRDNPFGEGGRSGLAEPVTVRNGKPLDHLLVAYATSPGRVALDGAPGGHGVYTGELLKALAEAGLEIEQVFRLARTRVVEASRGRQVPWEVTSLVRSVLLREGPENRLARDLLNRLAPVPRPAELGDLSSFRDCAACPEMVVLPAGSVRLGSPEGERGRRANEGPPVTVSMPRFAIARFEVSFAEWDACVLDGGCTRWPADGGFGRGDRPVTDVSWEDAREYVRWMTRRAAENLARIDAAGRHPRPEYRLPSEAEWEYAARAGTGMARPWGEEIGLGHAVCRECGSTGSGPAVRASPPPHPWGLAHMLGNVWEWTEDCRNDSQEGVMAAARSTGDCSQRSIRGGAWTTAARGVRSAARSFFPVTRRDSTIGFRVAFTVEAPARARAR